MLVDLCNAMLEARKHEYLNERQKEIVYRAEMIIRGLATVGIIALIDEATGYQEVRNRRALANILEKFLRKNCGHGQGRFLMNSTRESVY